MAKPNYNIDILNNLTPLEATQSAFAVLDQIQNIQPLENQVPAVAVMFILLCTRYNLNARDLLDKSEKIMRDSLLEGKGEQVRAIQQYLLLEQND